MSMAAGAQSVRESLMMRLDEARRVSDELFSIVRREALYERPIGERHRVIFYLGHLEAFDWNLLTATLFDASSLDPAFDKLFAFGIDPVGGGLPDDQPSDWPSVERVQRYNRRLRETIDQQLARLLSVAGNLRTAKSGSAASGAASAGDPGLILNLAIEHRLAHAETLAYMFHWLPVEQKISQAASLPLSVPQPVIPQAIPIPAGTATLGLARNGAFGWDNEFEQHTVSVPAFAVDRFKVTNTQFLEFVRAGGYSERAFWNDADWEWKEKQRVRHPRFWSERDESWRFRSMFGDEPLPGDCPVYVSHAEAGAYARWAGKSLPTEAQWHRAAYGTPSGREREFPWGDQAPTAQHGNFDFKSWDPAPVSAHPTGDSAFGVSDLLGNGWEWTSTRFAPFPGFEAFPFYPGYSANFFDGQHYVMKGGSMRTAACMLRRSFRNWFQPHYPHIYSGFRCVKNRGHMHIQGITPTGVAGFAQDVCDGLAKPQKELPSKSLYDDIGSELFEVITLLPEYGLSRAGQRLLRKHADQIIDRVPGPVMIAELGSGSGKKTRWILEAVSRRQFTRYYPIDISAAALARSRSELSEIPFVSLVGFEHDYLDGLLEVVARRRDGDHLLVLFLGSTIGNFDRPAGESFLREVRQQLIPGDSLLLAADLEKPIHQVELAYNDPLGVTAAFNLNLLARINRELGANFNLAGFEHLAPYNRRERRIEMHLRARSAHTVQIPGADLTVAFEEGETIWTESSHKFDLDELRQMAARTGFRCEAQWVDTEWPFAQNLWIAV